jgi:hypothetical protein
MLVSVLLDLIVRDGPRCTPKMRATKRVKRGSANSKEQSSQKSAEAELTVVEDALRMLASGRVRAEDDSLIALESTRRELRELLRAVMARDENQSALLVGPR